VEEEIFAKTFVKNSFVNSAVKNKYLQKSGNFWNYKFSIGQKWNNETCAFLGLGMVYLKWGSKEWKWPNGVIKIPIIFLKLCLRGLTAQWMQAKWQ